MCLTVVARPSTMAGRYKLLQDADFRLLDPANFIRLDWHERSLATC